MAAIRRSFFVQIILRWNRDWGNRNRGQQGSTRPLKKGKPNGLPFLQIIRVIPGTC